MKLKITLAVSIAVVYAQAAFAVEDYTDSPRSESRYDSAMFGEKWSPGVSVTVGHLEQSGRASSDGGNLSLQLLRSFSFPETYWVFDAGFGFQQQYLDDANQDSFLGMLSAAGRYKFPRQWSAGPVATLYIGDGDPYGKTEDVFPTLGVVAFREVALEDDHALKFGFKYATDVGTGQQTANYYGVVFEWSGQDSRTKVSGLF